jgi:IclR family transcriptional regulator, pca regulon regulatory protein
MSKTARRKPEQIVTGAASSDPDYMLSLARGLAVVRAFGDGGPELSISEVARATALSRAAARRCLHTLSVLGYAASSGGKFALTPRVLSLGYAYLGQTPFARVAQPILERVADTLHESSSLAVLDGLEVVYVARAATRRILSIGLSVGSRLPADCTSMGRVLVAFADDAERVRYLARVKLVRHTPYTIVDKRQLRAALNHVRQSGYAIVDQELELGLRSLAVPVRRHDRMVVAAINVGVHAGRVDAKTLSREYLPVLQDAALEIGMAIGHVIR